jgi:hypothetical protein
VKQRNIVSQGRRGLDDFWDLESRARGTKGKSKTLPQRAQRKRRGPRRGPRRGRRMNGKVKLA